MAEQAKLERTLKTLGPITVAVSGGVDSLTLATAVGRLSGHVAVVHAVSPAVPSEATARVEHEAAARGWHLTLVDAGEFADPDYLRNPVNRCYFCKTNLYRRIRQVAGGTIAAGTNTDDLGEYRPGLVAAAERGVVHPFVTAAMDKAAVRRLARSLGLGSIATLPAQPCLASRIETGIPVTAADLAFIAEAEAAVARITGPGDLRCRLTAAGIALELGPDLLGNAAAVDDAMSALCLAAERPFVGCRPYRRGSAFLIEAEA